MIAGPGDLSGLNTLSGGHVPKNRRRSTWQLREWPRLNSMLSCAPIPH